MASSYRSPPRYRNFTARARIMALKTATKASGYLRMALAGEGRDYRLVSLKDGKAVFRDRDGYVSVYLRRWQSERFVRDNPLALQPEAGATRHVVRFPRIDMARQASASEIMAAIGRYGSARTRMDLATFLDTYGGTERQRLFVALRRRIAERYPPTRMLDVGLCHGDVTRKNVGFRSDGSMAFIDWDDACMYAVGYDEIYFLLSEHSKAIGEDFTYANALRRLGLGGERLVIGDARRLLSEATGRDVDPLTCALFLLHYFGSVSKLDGVSGILLRDVDDVVW